MSQYKTFNFSSRGEAKNGADLPRQGVDVFVVTFSLALSIP